MARIRTIKPSFFTSLTIAELTPEQRLTFIGLWTHADDDGRCVADARLVKAAVWPLDDRVPDDIEEDLQALARHSLITLYRAGNRRLLEVASWSEHQVINRRMKSALPGPSEDGCEPLTCENASDHGGLTESSLSAHGGLTSGREGKGREGKGNSCAIVETETTACASADAERESDQPTSQTTSLEADFADWYDAYPRKRGRGQALRAYRAARKKADPQTLLDALEAQRESLTAKGDEFVPYPATWLNGERWADEVTKPKADPRIANEPIAQPPDGLTDEQMWAWHQEQRAKRNSLRMAAGVGHETP